ncbi:MAG TPA: cysteine desulfurase family protein [Flavobacteriaceae bacterium]|jgi:cysteine desulfurase
MKQVYFDSAATTQMRDEVIDRMTDVMRRNFGNASSTHHYGRASKALIENSRKAIASYFNVSASEIFFTSGGTEVDNLVLRSAVRDLGVTEVITSKIEHHAILHTVDELVKEYGISVKFVALETDGHIKYSHLEQLLDPSKKQLVSLMYVNNEIGNKLDIKWVADLCKTNQVLFHCDAVQAIGYYTLDLKDIPLDFFAASAHKFHGPKGVGFAFIRKHSGLRASIFGGDQERGLRSGTESIHNIVGMDEALRLSYDRLEEERSHILSLKQYFIEALKSNFPEVSFNGSCEDSEKSTYKLINVCLPITPEKAPLLQFQLDLKGIACSKGSACQSGSNQGSHVLSEILTPEQLAKPSVRFSFCKDNTKAEIDYVIEVLKEFIKD